MNDFLIANKDDPNAPATHKMDDHILDLITGQNKPIIILFRSESDASSDFQKNFEKTAASNKG